MTNISQITLPTVMHHAELFGNQFGGESWIGWDAYIHGLFGLPMTPKQAEVFRRHTGRTTLPTSAARESWMVVGRRGGKSIIASLIAVYLACFRDYREHLRPGEVATIMLIACDRLQARVLMRYVVGLLQSVPMLAAMIVNQKAESVELSNNVCVEVHTCSYKSVRGYSVAAVIADEVAFWATDYSSSPDTEVVNALRPALANLPGSLLLGIIAPYARRGVLWNEYSRHYGKDDPVLVWQSDTRGMNPVIDQSVIDEAYEDDEASASAEYGAQFRRDIEAFVSREAIEKCIVGGRLELPPTSDNRHFGFVDPRGGSADSFTLSKRRQSYCGSCQRSQTALLSQ